MFVILGVTLAGCAVSHVERDPLPLEHFCVGFFDALCEPLADCGCGEEAIARCRGQEAELCRGFPSAALVAAVEGGRLRYDAAGAAALVGAMRGRSAGCRSFVEALDWRVRDLFDVGGVFEGTLGAGESCGVLGFELLSECREGSCGALDGQYVCRRAVGIGERCDALHQCADLDATLSLELGIERLSLRCDDPVEGSCLARMPEGGACAVDADCEQGMCDGICRARRIGEACRLSRECESGHCSVERRICVAGDAPAGAPCDADEACASQVCLGGACLPTGCGTF